MVCAPARAALAGDDTIARERQCRRTVPGISVKKVRDCGLMLAIPVG